MAFRVVQVFEGGKEEQVGREYTDQQQGMEALQSYERDRIYRGDLNHFFALRGPGLPRDQFEVVAQQAAKDAAFFAAARAYQPTGPTPQQLHDRDTAERAIAHFLDGIREQDLMERGLVEVVP